MSYSSDEPFGMKKVRSIMINGDTEADSLQAIASERKSIEPAIDVGLRLWSQLTWASKANTVNSTASGPVKAVIHPISML
jgi:hypothetical protein